MILMKFFNFYQKNTKLTSKFIIYVDKMIEFIKMKNILISKLQIFLLKIIILVN